MSEKTPSEHVVRGCMTCPLCDKGYFYFICQHKRPCMRVEDYGDGPPYDCPLRDRPALLRLDGRIKR